MVSMHPISSVLLSCMSGLLLCFPLGAAANGNENAVLLLYSPPSSLVEDVAAELRAAGFAPVLEEETPSEPSEKINPAAAGVQAVVLVKPGDQGIVVVVSDPSRGVSMSTEVAGTDAGKRTGVVLAIKTVELLRAALLAPAEGLPAAETAIEEKPAEPKAAMSPAVSDVDDDGAERSRRNGLAFFYLAPGATFGFGGLPPMLHLEAALSMHIASRFRIYLFGLIPTFAAEVTGKEGAAKVRFGAVTAGVSAELINPRRRVQASVGVECGAGIVSASGTSAVREDEASPRGTAFDLNFRVGFRVRLHRVLFLRSDALVGALMPRPTVRIYGEELASFGRPLISAALGLEVTLF